MNPIRCRTFVSGPLTSSLNIARHAGPIAISQSSHQFRCATTVENLIAKRGNSGGSAGTGCRLMFMLNGIRSDEIAGYFLPHDHAASGPQGSQGEQEWFLYPIFSA